MLERGPQASPGTLRHHSLIGFDDVDLRPSFTQLARNHVARDFRPHQQHPLPFHFRLQTAHHRFRHVFFRNHVNLHSALLDRFLRSGPYRGNAQVLQGALLNPQFLHSRPHGLDAVDAGQDEPVIDRQIFQCGVECLKRFGLANLDERNLHDIRAALAQFAGERAGLMAGPAH